MNWIEQLSELGNVLQNVSYATLLLFTLKTLLFYGFWFYVVIFIPKFIIKNFQKLPDQQEKNDKDYLDTVEKLQLDINVIKQNQDYQIFHHLGAQKETIIEALKLYEERKKNKNNH